MKIRNGFVSNSSSSSFIVVWDSKPNSVEEVQQILFGNEDVHHYYDEEFNPKELAQIIFNDTTKMSEEDIMDQQAELYCYNNWGSNHHWYSRGYKPNEKLCKKYEEEMCFASNEETKLKDILETFSEKEKQTFVRKGKLERVLNEKSTNDRESLYFETTEKLKEVRQSMWRSNKTMDELVSDSTKKLLKDFDGKFIATYHYSDNDGSIQSCLEHSDIFSNLTYWQISHH